MDAKADRTQETIQHTARNAALASTVVHVRAPADALEIRDGGVFIPTDRISEVWTTQATAEQQQEGTDGE